jgi:hypothetical protein
MSSLQALQEQQRIQYHKYVEQVKAQLIPYNIGDKKEIYDDGNHMQKVAIQDVAAQLAATADLKVEVGHYVDMPDPENMPYGFIRGYHTVTFVKP